MTDYQTHITHNFFFIAKWYVICTVIFIPLAYLFPSNQTQPIWRKGMFTDTLYWFADVIYSLIFKFTAIFFLVSIYSTVTIKELTSNGLAPVARWPLWIQILLLLIATDFLQYWMHRLFHHASFWKIHAIHHSSKHVDWLSAARFHPLNTILYATTINALVFLIGFHPDAYLYLLPFIMIYPAFVHANINCNFGPLRYVLASPIFHRWHHTGPDQGGNKNFAPTFPIWDVLFGTYYDPKGLRPEQFGVVEEVGEGLLGQLRFPFR